LKEAFMKSHFYGLAVLGLASGCYLQPSAVNNPQPSAEGVTVRLLGQDCEDHRGSKGDPVSRELGVKVRVDNPTDATLRISEDSIRLFVEGASAAVRWPTMIEVSPHGSATLSMEFAHHALCEPDRQFVVAWNGAFALDDHRVALANLAFRP
jgi:hypothetical protein